MIRIAYHLHVKEDKIPPWRGIYSAEEAFKRLYDQEIRVMGITDKNSVRGIKELKGNGFEERFGVYIPVSSEVRTRNISELLVVFDKLDADIEGMITHGTERDPLYIAQYTKDKGGKVILQHMFGSPVGVGKKVGEELCKRNLVDAVEWNYKLRRRENLNEKAVRFAEEHNLPVVYGCDNYFARVGVVMKVDEENPREAFWKIFEGGFGKPSFVVEHANSSLWNRIVETCYDLRQTYHGGVTEPLLTLEILRDLFKREKDS